VADRTARVPGPPQAAESGPIRAVRAATVVIKDADHDPDVTRGVIGQSVGESVDLKAREVRVVISVPDGETTERKKLGTRGGISMLGPTGIVRPFSTVSWRVSVERAVSAMAAQGEKTLVLCARGRTGKGAARLLPRLPDACFVEAGDFTGAALRRAVEHGIRQVVFVGMAGTLTKLASGMPMTHYTRSGAEPLAEITGAMGGSEELVGRVAAAGTARHAYELWEAEGLLGRCGRELCRRGAGVLEELAGAEIAAQVVLVDLTGQHMIAMYGRLSR
jgi:cobalt-precorrin-5B (C1)-methyltransferase